MFSYKQKIDVEELKKKEIKIIQNILGFKKS